MAADGLERALDLYALLLRAHAHEPLTHAAAREAVADQFGDWEGPSGRRAFHRDRAHLTAVGAAIDSGYATGKAGVPGWWIRPERYHLPGLVLTDDERVALDRATRVVDFADVLWAPLAAAKLADHRHDGPVGSPGSAGTGADGGGGGGGGGEGGGASSLGTLAVFVAPAALPALQDARARGTTVRFRYHGRERHLEPWGLASARGHWYLVAADASVAADAPVGAPAGDGGDGGGADTVDVDRDRGPRVFRVDRIQGPVARGGRDGVVTIPADFDVSAHVPTDLWGWGGDPFEVAAAVDAEVAGIVAADVGAAVASTARADGRVELRFACTQRGVFVSWVLGLGDRAEVLAPADLRAEVVARLRAMAVAGADTEIPEDGADRGGEDAS